MKLSTDDADSILLKATTQADTLLGAFANKKIAEGVRDYYRTFLTRSENPEEVAAGVVTKFYAPKKLGFIPFAAYSGKIRQYDEFYDIDEKSAIDLKQPLSLAMTLRLFYMVIFMIILWIFFMILFI